MINLYQKLDILPTASEAEIQAALISKQAQLEPKIIQAIQAWLLVADVRVRYDAKLQEVYPEFFQIDGLVENEAEQSILQLWQPEIIMLLALIFSPIFGAWLVAMNWREIGEDADAQFNLYVVWGLIALALLMVLVSSVTGMVVSPLLSVMVAVFVWACWFGLLGREQLNFVRNELDNVYEYKSWLKPIIVLLIGILVYFVCIILLILLLKQLGLLHPSLAA
ncbi:hypothetical protein MIS45_00330 [Wielerella bovis]|uniref:hypothetical protein n=1 Tax=Wielerella bovis TaxID=2917790 RepID=UPI00201A1A22|nr:hypothetical protein [Wielerella bovis]ULJ69367.1 hypothetical protein MIS45_00330 [Wielerella bovis]